MNLEDTVDLIRALDLLIAHEKELGLYGKVERLICLQTNLRTNIKEVTVNE